LRADLLDASHSLSQEIATPEGSYWHGILHRREPDWSNAAYWFRKVGKHTVFDELAPAAPSVASEDLVGELAPAGAWNPFRFIDACEACEGGRRRALRDDLLRLQDLEMELLFAHCFREATGA